MKSFGRRVGAIERSAGHRRLTWLVRKRVGETADQAITRIKAAESLAPFVLVAPEVSRTIAEWVSRHAGEQA